MRETVIRRLGASVLLLTLACATSHAWAQAAAEPAEPKTEATGEGGPEEFQVVRLMFRGNRKVEDDAIRVNIRTGPGVTLTRDVLREDVRAIWKMGFFEDVQVEVAPTEGGVNVVFVVKEKPSIRKIYVAGGDEVGLTKINEVLDIKREQILDLAKVKANVEKIRDLFIQRGFYMAQVDYEIRRATPNEVDVWFRVQQNEKVEVRRINFVGNRAATDSELRSVMATQAGDLLSFITSAGTYREDVFQRDLLILQSFYFDRGYVNVKISEPKLELSPDKRSLFITIPIEEGQQYRIGKLDVTGDLLESREFYMARLQSKSGEIFNRSKLTQDRTALEDFYKDRGYAYANPTPLVNPDPNTLKVDVVFDIQKGSKVKIERITIRGNTKTRDKVIRREMRIAEGDEYDKSKIDFSKRRVTALGFFERVEISEERGETDEYMRINVEVAERQTGAFQIGAGFSSVESFIAQAQISQNNLFGRGQLLTLQAQLSGLRQLFLLQFQDPYFLDTNWTFGFNLYNQQRFFYSFYRASTGGSLTWGYLLTDDLRLFLTYTLEDVSIRTTGRSSIFSSGLRTPLPAGSLANLLRSGINSSWRVSLAYDTRDNRLFTKRGWFNTASAEFAERIFFSENIYDRFEASTRFYYPIWGPFILRMWLEGGLIFSRDPQGVPISERYFLGGIFDVRGFTPRSLGPQIRAPDSQSPDSSLNNFRVGGNLQVHGTTEIEFPLIEKVGIKGVVFVDAGNSYNLESQYCRLRPANVDISADPCVKLFPLSSLRTSWGFGFRWFSPIGPLRFEWGIPFRTLPGEQPLIFEFTIGNFF